MDNTAIIKSLNEARLLGVFKSICDANSTNVERKKLQNILLYSSDKKHTIKAIVSRDYNVDLCDEECEKLFKLLDAYFKKNKFRKGLDMNQKKELIIAQNNRCAICNCEILQKYHADHIIPFKYVGDILEDNWQMLCSHCNEKKSANIDYQIKYLLYLV